MNVCVVQYSLTPCHILSTEQGTSDTVQVHFLLHWAENLMKTQVSDGYVITATLCGKWLDCLFMMCVI